MRALSDYIDELRGLDQNNIGSWPTWAYGLAIALVAAVIALAASWYFVWPAQARLASAERHETQLKQRFRIKQNQVANLTAYRNQLDTVRAEFADLLEQLPSKSEVPSLLREISQTRAANGLEEQLFKPDDSQRRDFYAVLPNDLIVTGSFHDLARFVSGVAALPRIVTLDDVDIEPVKNTPGVLRMQVTARTYRYLDEANANDAPANKDGGS